MGSSRLVSLGGSVGCLLVGFKKCLGKNKLEFTRGLSTGGHAAPCPHPPRLAVLTGGGGATGIWRVEARGASQFLAVHRTALPPGDPAECQG